MQYHGTFYFAHCKGRGFPGTGSEAHNRLLYGLMRQHQSDVWRRCVRYQVQAKLLCNCTVLVTAKLLDISYGRRSIVLLATKDDSSLPAVCIS